MVRIIKLRHVVIKKLATPDIIAKKSAPKIGAQKFAIPSLKFLPGLRFADV